jgi:hypothetical protein
MVGRTHLNVTFYVLCLSRSAAMLRRCNVFWCDAVRLIATWRLCVEVSFCAMQTVRVPGWCAHCVLVRPLLEGRLWSVNFTLFRVVLNDRVRLAQEFVARLKDAAVQLRALSIRRYDSVRNEPREMQLLRRSSKLLHSPSPCSQTPPLYHVLSHFSRVIKGSDVGCAGNTNVHYAYLTSILVISFLCVRLFASDFRLQFCLHSSPFHPVLVARKMSYMLCGARYVWHTYGQYCTHIAYQPNFYHFLSDNIVCTVWITGVVP